MKIMMSVPGAANPALQRRRRGAYGSAGFTVIELMIVVAVIAILSAIALPSYSAYMARGYRAEARAALMQAAQWMERVATATGTYPSALPNTLKSVPSDTYSIAANVDTDGLTFTLTATAKGRQANDRCGNYTLTNAGETGVTGATGGASASECWGR